MTTCGVHHVQRAIFERLGDPVLIIDRQLAIRWANRLLLQAVPCSLQELAGLDLARLLRQLFSLPLEEGLAARLVRVCAHGEQLELAHCHRAEDGSPARTELRAFPLPGEDGEPEQAVVIFRRAAAGDEPEERSRTRQVETELRKTNEFLTNLIESSIDGIISADMKGTVIIFNKGAEKLTGYKAHEVIGKFNAANFYPPGVAREIMAKLRDARYGGKGKLLPTRITGITKSGEELPLSISGALIYQDGREVASVGIFYDLREILKAQDSALESEARFRELFEQVQHGVYSSTRDGKFLDGNPALLRMLGYSKEEFLAIDIAHDLYLDPQDRSEFQRLIEQDGAVRDHEVKFRKNDGEPIDVLLTASVTKDRRGTVVGYQGLVFDLTRRKKLEQQVFQSEKLAAMGRLTAQVAHELNNPICGVLNCLDLLRSEVPESNRKRRFLDMAYSEASRMSQLLRSMISFFRPDEDSRTAVDLNKLVDDVVLFVGKQLEAFRIRVKLELAGDLPKLQASANQLKQVLLNMIMNAKTAMAQGGDLTISTHHEGGQVLLAIADTGIGIPPENIGRIFDAFFTTKGDVKGVGLGLSVCFGIIREHRGRIDVSSEVGRGTTFTVTLPVG